MNKLLNKSLVTALLFALILSAMPAFATPPAAPDAIWIEPYPGGISFDTSTVSLGYEFTVTVWAKSSKTCGAWSFRLAYNKEHLTYVSAVYSGPGGGKSMFFKDIATVPVSPVHASINATHNRIDFGESWAGVGPMRDPGSDSLAIVTFRVNKVPFKYETLLSWLGVGEFDVGRAGVTASKTYMLDSVGAKYGEGFDIPYKFEWAPPPRPYLISAPSRFYDRYTNWVGTTFVETITLNVDAAWFLTNATFIMSFNKDFLEILSVSIDPLWDVASSYTIDNLNGRVQIFVETSANIGGNVPVASVTFRIKAQGSYPTVHTSTLSFSNVVFYDHVGTITPGTHQAATITLEGYLAVHMPYLSVEPNTQVHGPEYAIDKEITVKIDIKRLHFAWKLVGVEFRLNYDPAVLEVVSVTEGPYFGGYAPYGTWFKSYIEPDYWGPHILVGELILPNGTGYWNPPYPGAEWGQPGENGTLAIITFKIKQQPIWPDEITTYLGLFRIRGIGATGDMVPFDTPVNGTVKIRGFAGLGRQIDLYGGASNAGYGPFPDPWPAPYGGQGPNKPMDLVIPQSDVVLYASVLYNFWPVQQKDVGFEVEGPYEHVNGQLVPKQSWRILLKTTARTNADGIAKITFAMPWPCENPEALLGVWKVTATVNIRDEIVTDTLYFYYDYMVHIFKVTTDKFYYEHCETVNVVIQYGSHAMQRYPALFVAVIKDELNVPFMGMKETEVGGAVFCTWANGTITIPIHVDKWMFAGYADISVDCFDKDPTVGGFAWCPQYFIDNAIYILPK